MNTVALWFIQTHGSKVGESESKTKELMDVKDLQVNTDDDIDNDDNGEK